MSQISDTLIGHSLSLFLQSCLTYPSLRLTLVWLTSLCEQMLPCWRLNREAYL